MNVFNVLMLNIDFVNIDVNNYKNKVNVFLNQCFFQWMDYCNIKLKMLKHLHTIQTMYIVDIFYLS